VAHEVKAAGVKKRDGSAYGIEFTWEYALIDHERPWADDVPPKTRARIERYLANDVYAARERERRERIKAIQEDMRSGRRPRLKLPGE
jgi:hypothetical protein